MHDCSVEVGDRWLRRNLFSYLHWARTHNSLLIITFDESKPAHAGNRIVTLVDGTGVRAEQTGEPVDHDRLLRTIEMMYQLPALGHADDSTPITDIWTSRPRPRRHARSTARRHGGRSVGHAARHRDRRGVLTTTQGRRRCMRRLHGVGQHPPGKAKVVGPGTRIRSSTGPNTGLSTRCSPPSRRPPAHELPGW
jgi:hypothetical protein